MIELGNHSVVAFCDSLELTPNATVLSVKKKEKDGIHRFLDIKEFVAHEASSWETTHVHI